MLVLSRQKDESIMIGDDVEIIVVDIRGDKVRLGITAPRVIPVHRREIYDAIQKEKKQKQAQEQAEKKDNEQPKEVQEEQPKKLSQQAPPKDAKKQPEKKSYKQRQRQK